MDEAATYNAVFVPVTVREARQGDNATPIEFLSIQSDEARHMANGYATLVAAMSEPDNIPLIQQDLNDGFWRGSRFLRSFLGWVFDYGVTGPMGPSYADLWDK